MIRINLVPTEILAKARQKQQVMQAGAAGALVLIVLVVISGAHYYKLKRLERQLKADQADLKKLEVIVAQVEELERTAAAVRARLGVITDLLRGRALYPRFMADFVRSVPMGVRVRTLGTTGGGSSAAPLRLTISAETRNNDDIAVWTKKLERSGMFSNIELGAVTATDSGAGTDRTVTFSLTSTYTPKL